MRAGVFSSLTLVLAAASAVLGRDDYDYCSNTCLSVASSGSWGCTSYDGNDYQICLCSSEAAIETFALCSDTYCSGGWGVWSSYCSSYAGIKMDDFDTVLAAAKAADPLSYDNISLLTVGTEPYTMPQSEFETMLNTNIAFYQSRLFGELYGAATMIFLFGIFFLAFVKRIINLVIPKTAVINSPFVARLRKWFIVPAAFCTTHTAPLKIFGVGYAMMPTRGQTLMVVSVMIMNFIFLFVRYNIFNNNYYWPDEEYYQVVRYFSDRSGIMAFVQIPVLILFAGRNNFLMWLTGWSYETYMVYHRWVARIMFFNAVIHSIGYTAYVLFAGSASLAESFEETYWRWGVVATVFGGVIMFQAMYFLRHRWYETFLVLHIVFVIIFIVGIWYHCVTLGYMEYVYASIAIWGFDRVVRFIRMSSFGFNCPAQVKLVGDVLMLEIKAQGLKWSDGPGKYAYIYFWKFNFWENHPFSLVERRGDTYIFAAKAKDGLTKKVFKYVASQADQSALMSVMVEGPYGESFQVEPFGTVLLIAGGIGVTAMYPYAKKLANLQIPGQHIILHWICHSDDTVKSLLSEMKGLSGTGVEVHVHVTTGKVDDLLTSSDSEKDEKTSNDDASGLSSLVSIGRPELDQLISSTIANADKSVAVAVCGPDSMNDTCRRSTANHLVGPHHVEYFEEAFAWA
ncbi:ferric reductase like transmembrane component-domain-containing protein [Lipomyces oligophaga]|uniref:ferric reductase like transmembrane component-domain-containing protein n=1 Tax=Lipomyces oligophaga TaxID=45792 RepID=UPI0034CEE6C2